MTMKKVADMNEAFTMIQNDVEIIEICNMIGYYPHYYPAYMWVMIEDGEITEAYGGYSAGMNENVRVIK